MHPGFCHILSPLSKSIFHSKYILHIFSRVTDKRYVNSLLVFRKPGTGFLCGKVTLLFPKQLSTSSKHTRNRACGSKVNPRAILGHSSYICPSLTVPCIPSHNEVSSFPVFVISRQRPPCSKPRHHFSWLLKLWAFAPRRSFKRNCS